jgi:hypothetical protein
MQKARRLPGHQLTLRSPSCGNSLVSAQRDEAVQLRLQPLGTRDDGTDYLDGRNILADNPRAKLGSGQEAQFVAHRSGALSIGLILRMTFAFASGKPAR